MNCEFVKNFVDKIVCEFGADDVLTIAEKADVSVVYQRWFPVTIGEFDRKTRTICVNLNTTEKIEKVIAHELGHFFAAEFNFDKKEEESFARQFAECLTGEK